MLLVAGGGSALRSPGCRWAATRARLLDGEHGPDGGDVCETLHLDGAARQTLRGATRTLALPRSAGGLRVTEGLEASTREAEYWSGRVAPARIPVKHPKSEGDNRLRGISSPQAMHRRKTAANRQRLTTPHHGGGK